MSSRKTKQLAADHKRGWHEENSFASAGCPLCQREEDDVYEKRPEDELLRKEAQEGKRRVQDKLEDQ